MQLSKFFLFFLQDFFHVFLVILLILDRKLSLFRQKRLNRFVVRKTCKNSDKNVKSSKVFATNSDF